MTGSVKKMSRGGCPQFIVDTNCERILPASSRKKLLEIIGTQIQGGEKFLDEIEHAVWMAWITQEEASNQSPKKVSSRLETAAVASEKLLETLFKIDKRGQKLFHEVTRDDAQPMTVDVAIETTTELLLSLRAASNRAKIGKGNTKKSYVFVLAASVAQALRNVGIEPKLWRTKITRTGEKKNPYLACLEIAFKCLGGIGTKDLYRIAREGLKIKISSPEDAASI